MFSFSEEVTWVGSTRRTPNYYVLKDSGMSVDANLNSHSLFADMSQNPLGVRHRIFGGIRSANQQSVNTRS
jgi:hypothetical protein